MTICMTVVTRRRDRIIAGCDTRVVLWTEKGYRVFNCRKFAISRRRNILFLISGMWYGVKGNPRTIIEERVEKLLNKEDSVFEGAEKAYEHLLPLYPKVNERGWQLQVCGFDGDLSKVCVVLSNPPPHRATIEEVPSGAITGTEGVFAFTREHGVPPLGSLFTTEDNIIDAMKKYMRLAIKFENEWAIHQKRPPMTGGGVNILVVHQDKIEWKEPRYYSPKDEKKLEKI